MNYARMLFGGQRVLAGSHWIGLMLLLLSGCKSPVEVEPPPADPSAVSSYPSYWTFEVQVPPVELFNHTGFSVPANVEQMPRQSSSATPEEMLQDPLPDQFDWREHGVVGPVRNQGDCGSCWAHAVCTIAESALAIEYGTRPTLSWEWLNNCNTDGWGCQGGQIALPYLVDKPDRCGEVGGVIEDESMEFDADCLCDGQRVPRFDGWGMISTRDQLADPESIKRIIFETGPIIATVRVSSPFLGYAEGVFNYDGPTFPIDFLHLVVITGWEEREGRGFWFMQNSWGEEWGETGAMRIAYGVSGIAEYAAALGQASNESNQDSDALADGGNQDSGQGTGGTEAEAQGDGAEGAGTSVASGDSEGSAGDGSDQDEATQAEQELAQDGSETDQQESEDTTGNSEDSNEAMSSEEIGIEEASGSEDGGIPEQQLDEPDEVDLDQAGAASDVEQLVVIDQQAESSIDMPDVPQQENPDQRISDEGLPRLDTIVEELDFLEKALDSRPLGVDVPLPVMEGVEEGADSFELDPKSVQRVQTGLVGVWKQVAGPNGPGVAPGGHLHSVLRISASGLLEWRNRHDEDGRLRTITRLDWVQEGQEIVVGQSKLLRDRRMDTNLQLPGPGGKRWAIIAPRKALPARLKWSLRGQDLVLDGRRYQKVEPPK